MKFDAISFIPQRPFIPEKNGNEFDSDLYCLNLDGSIILHLKKEYLDSLLEHIPSKERQIHKWYFYTAHLNCLYLLLDSIVLKEMKIGYFNLEEINTQNSDVVSGSGVTISPKSNRNNLGVKANRKCQVFGKLKMSVN